MKIPTLYTLSVFLLGAVLGWLGSSMAGRASVEAGDTHDLQESSVYLLEEPVEAAGYVNHWWAYCGRREPGAELQVTVVGEGKLVDFCGTLSAAGEDDELAWAAAWSYGEAVPLAGIERLVPAQALANLQAYSRSR